MIEIKNLSKSFGSKTIFKDFNLKIRSSSMMAIIGKSGTGKSTLLNIIGLLDLDYEGTILYDNENVSMLKEKNVIKYIRDNINYLFQNYALIDDATVEYNLLLALAYEKISKKEKLEKIEIALSEVSLSNYNGKMIYELSGGEQQRIALARILLKRGNIILADEPTGNLDEHNALKVLEILKKMRDKGKTIIIATHDQKIAQECDTLIEL